MVTQGEFDRLLLRPLSVVFQFAVNHINLVGLVQPNGKYGPILMVQTLVYYEPDDPDPNRRFKMIYEIDGYIRDWPRERTADVVQCYAAFSADGLRWKASAHNPGLANAFGPPSPQLKSRS